MTDSHFMQLLAAAKSQPQPQRLLFLFASSELPDDADAEQRRRFEAGEGGALAPLMCVDKHPDEVADFAQRCGRPLRRLRQPGAAAGVRLIRQPSHGAV